MKNVKVFLLACCFIITECVFGQRIVSTTSLLNELIDPSSITKWPNPFYQEVQASSYDRKSVSPQKPGWFANADASKYIRTENKGNRKENVMMDAEGPGAIVRFWLTTFKREGTLRIYFDNQTEPEITIPAYDLLKTNLPVGKGLLLKHSSYELKEKGGSTLYLPMPFQKQCKVTWEEGDSANKQPRYYQINYRKYSAGTGVKTFTVQELNGLQQLADEAGEILLHPKDEAKGKQVHLQKSVGAGANAVLALPNGASAITLLKLKLQVKDTSRYRAALHSTLIKISFDNKETVSCPLDLFSGSGIGGKEIQSWYRTVTPDGLITSRWVMPYRRAATMTIQNTGSEEVDINLDGIVAPQKWDNNTMYFHATWKEENNIAISKSDTGKVGEWALNTMTGKGVFAGETFSVNNHMHYWYGEGDQKLWVDNETFPSEFGTGTEDYFNTSWAPVVIYQTPFANATRADNADSYGDNTFTRTRNLDAVPFTKHFNYTLEMLGWENGSIDASVVTYWYGFGSANDDVVK